MFSIEKKRFGSLDKYELINTSSEEKIGIIPAYGGLLNEWYIMGANGRMQLFENYASEHELARDHDMNFRGFKLIPYPNRVANRRYQHEGVEHLLEQCKIGEPNSIHGFLTGSAMQVLKQETGDDYAQISLSYSHTGNSPGYPFLFDLIITYRLHQRSGLTIETKVTNTGDTSMPFGDGWHPYFYSENGIEGLELQFSASHKLELGSYGIPNGRYLPFDQFGELSPIIGCQLDDCFVLSDNKVLLHYPSENVTLELWQEMGQGRYNFLQIYTPEHRKSIAIEPMTCEPNAFNTGNGLITIQPRETVALVHGVRIIKRQ